MRIKNNLDDWLILPHSWDVLISHTNSLFRYLESLRLCVNMQKSMFTPSHSVAMRACLSQEHIETISSTLCHFRPGCYPEEISEPIGTYDVGFISLLSGPSAYVTAAVMAENSSPLEGVDLGHICILVTHN